MSNNVTYKQMETYFEILRPGKKIFDLELTSSLQLTQRKRFSQASNPTGG